MSDSSIAPYCSIVRFVCRKYHSLAAKGAAVTPFIRSAADRLRLLEGDQPSAVDYPQRKQAYFQWSHRAIKAYSIGLQVNSMLTHPVVGDSAYLHPRQTDGASAAAMSYSEIEQII
jgi:hypothetical protein